MLPFERCKRCKLRKSEAFPNCFAGGDAGYGECYNFVDRGTIEPTLYFRAGKWYGTVKTKGCETKEEAALSLKDLIKNS